MSKHHGEVLAKAIRNSGYPITKIAVRVGYTRQHFYNLFSKKKINLELLYEIGKIINVNILDELKGNAKILKEHVFIKEDEVDYKELYYALLEQQNKILKENYSLLKKLRK
jgi:hypothetical protein